MLYLLNTSNKNNKLINKNDQKNQFMVMVFYRCMTICHNKQNKVVSKYIEHIKNNFRLNVSSTDVGGNFLLYDNNKISPLDYNAASHLQFEMSQRNLCHTLHRIEEGKLNSMPHSSAYNFMGEYENQSDKKVDSFIKLDFQQVIELLNTNLKLNSGEINEIKFSKSTESTRMVSVKLTTILSNAIGQNDTALINSQNLKKIFRDILIRCYIFQPSDFNSHPGLGPEYIRFTMFSNYLGASIFETIYANLIGDIVDLKLKAWSMEIKLKQLETKESKHARWCFVQYYKLIDLATTLITFIEQLEVGFDQKIYNEFNREFTSFIDQVCNLFSIKKDKELQMFINLIDFKKIIILFFTKIKYKFEFDSIYIQIGAYILDAIAKSFPNDFQIQNLVEFRGERFFILKSSHIVNTAPIEEPWIVYPGDYLILPSESEILNNNVSCDPDEQIPLYRVLEPMGITLIRDANTYYGSKTELYSWNWNREVISITRKLIDSINMTNRNQYSFNREQIDTIYQLMGELSEYSELYPNIKLTLMDNFSNEKLSSIFSNTNCKELVVISNNLIKMYGLFETYNKILHQYKNFYHSIIDNSEILNILNLIKLLYDKNFKDVIMNIDNLDEKMRQDIIKQFRDFKISESQQDIWEFLNADTDPFYGEIRLKIMVILYKISYLNQILELLPFTFDISDINTMYFKPEYSVARHYAAKEKINFYYLETGVIYAADLIQIYQEISSKKLTLYYFVRVTHKYRHFGILYFPVRLDARNRLVPRVTLINLFSNDLIESTIQYSFIHIEFSRLGGPQSLPITIRRRLGGSHYVALITSLAEYYSKQTKQMSIIERLNYFSKEMVTNLLETNFAFELSQMSEPFKCLCILRVLKEFHMLGGLCEGLQPYERYIAERDQKINLLDELIFVKDATLDLIYYTPLGPDFRASALQISGILMKNDKTASILNLNASSVFDRPRDVYNEMSEAVLENLNTLNLQLSNNFKKKLFDRKTSKLLCMPYIYGEGNQGRVNKLMTKYSEMGITNSLEIGGYVNQFFLAAFQEKVPSCVDFRNYIENTLKIFHKLDNTRPFILKTPLSIFSIKPRVAKRKTKVLKIFLLNKRKESARLQVYSSKINLQELIRKVLSDAIQGFDASIANIIQLRFREKLKEFLIAHSIYSDIVFDYLIALVLKHDELKAPIGVFSILYRVSREVMVELFNDEKIKQFFLDLLGKNNLTEHDLPKFGLYCISEILKAEYPLS